MSIEESSQINGGIRELIKVLRALMTDEGRSFFEWGNNLGESKSRGANEPLSPPVFDLGSKVIITSITTCTSFLSFGLTQFSSDLVISKISAASDDRITLLLTACQSLIC